jgi:hypothetical protein
MMLERHTWTAGVRLDSRIALLLGLLCLADIQAAETLSPQLQDPHRNAAGFFDIHVCNWPDRDLFFMSLFSTPRFEEVEQVEVFFPNGSLLTRLDLGNYRTIHHKEKPDKRVFMNEIDVPPGAPDGWYSTRVTLKDGKRHIARDYVILSPLPQATGQVPAHEAEVKGVPAELGWDPVPGAGYYQVFLRDLWNDGKMIFSSKLLDEPRVQLPPDLLEAGGYYSWIVHARDLNEHYMLGDFNHGSISPVYTFSIAP